MGSHNQVNVDDVENLVEVSGTGNTLAARMASVQLGDLVLLFLEAVGLGLKVDEDLGDVSNSSLD